MATNALGSSHIHCRQLAPGISQAWVACWPAVPPYAPAQPTHPPNPEHTSTHIHTWELVLMRPAPASCSTQGVVWRRQVECQARYRWRRTASPAASVPMHMRNLRYMHDRAHRTWHSMVQRGSAWLSMAQSHGASGGSGSAGAAGQAAQQARVPCAPKHSRHNQDDLLQRLPARTHSTEEGRVGATWSDAGSAASIAIHHPWCTACPVTSRRALPAETRCGSAPHASRCTPRRHKAPTHTHTHTHASSRLAWTLLRAAPRCPG